MAKSTKTWGRYVMDIEGTEKVQVTIADQRQGGGPPAAGPPGAAGSPGTAADPAATAGSLTTAAGQTATATPAPDRTVLPDWVTKLKIGTLTAGAVSTVLVALRLLSVAKFNPETAYGILQSSGTSDILIGTVMSVLPSVAIIAGSCLVLARIFLVPNHLKPPAEFAAWASIAILAGITLLTIPVRYGIAVVLCAIAILIVWRNKAKIDMNAPLAGKAGRFITRGVAFIFATILIIGIAATPPWMPEEHLTFNGATSPVAVTGYVLTETADGMIILQAKPRRIRYFAPHTLKSRFMCLNPPRWDFPIIFYVPGFNPVHYQNC
jgi:hypothetical protein